MDGMDPMGHSTKGMLLFGFNLVMICPRSTFLKTIILTFECFV